MVRSAARTRVNAEGPWSSELLLPALVVSRYLFFLTRRPISRSNTHYALRRIDGLQSLAPAFESSSFARAAMSARLLRSLNPGNLHETAERLQLTLAPLVRSAIPRGYIAGDAAPPGDFLRDVASVLLVLGPGIGIGDEIVTFPLPRWLKAVAPRAQVTVLSTYDGLWGRVAGVDRTELYWDHQSLLAALRNDGPLGTHDLVALVDFENPELYQAIAWEGRLARYLELSIGGHAMAAVDTRRRWIHRRVEAAPAFGNYYYGLSRLARGLGLSPAVGDHFTAVDRRPAPEGDAVRIYVSPFTSKYDPSPRYWSQLIASIVPPDPPHPVRVAFDPGPNLTTRAFAEDLARAAASRRGGPSVEFAVADAHQGRGLPLAGVFDELERAHAVICADSFAAHAAPAMGRTTLVLAAPGLEDWRVPSPWSFYFTDGAPLADIAAGMQQVLARRGHLRLRNLPAPAIAEPERRLAAAGHDLDRVADGTPVESFPALCDSYDRFCGAYRDVVERLADWPHPVRGVLADTVYDAAHQEIDGVRPDTAALRDDVVRHVQDARREWRNTNLSKYLALVLQGDDA
jgi:hypothetical protein